MTCAKADHTPDERRPDEKTGDAMGVKSVGLAVDAGIVLKCHYCAFDEFVRLEVFLLLRKLRCLALVFIDWVHNSIV